MKRLLLFTLISLFSIACAQGSELDYKNIFSSDSVIIDVRTPEEFDSGHLDGAINIPYEEIRTKIKEAVPDKKKTVTVYCRSGNRSSAAQKTLKSMGYENVINGGAYGTLKKKQAEFK